MFKLSEACILQRAVAVRIRMEMCKAITRCMYKRCGFVRTVKTVAVFACTKRNFSQLFVEKIVDYFGNIGRQSKHRSFIRRVSVLTKT